MVIRNIWGVGRNYAAHAAELGNAVPERPLIFLKAGSSATVNSNEIHLPWWASEAHHEVELALKFGSRLQISEAAVALDLTHRTFQNEAKAQGLPWTLAKSFHNACAVSAFFTIKSLDEVRDLELSLTINGEVKQKARTSMMIFPLEKLVDSVLTYFPVCPGDLLLTGTPAGVGPLQDGDHLVAKIENQITHNWRVHIDKKPASV